MADETITKLVPLHKLLSNFLDNTNLTLAEHGAVSKALSKAARQHGVQAADICLVEVTSEVAGKKVRSIDLGFHNTDPQHAGDLITVTKSNQRVWEPVNKVNQHALFEDTKDAPAS